MTAPAYATLADLKAELLLDVTNTDYDARLTQLLLDASRYIDNYTGRRFYGDTLTKLYAPEPDGSIVYTDDIISVTSVQVTYTGHWDSAITLTNGTDYALYPFNASQLGQPYRAIVRDPLYARYAFPMIQAGGASPLGYRAGLSWFFPTVRITGSFGYSATAPENVVNATRRIAMRLFKIADAPFGVLGISTESGEPARIQVDQEVKTMLQPFRRTFIL